MKEITIKTELSREALLGYKLELEGASADLGLQEAIDVAAELLGALADALAVKDDMDKEVAPIKLALKNTLRNVSGNPTEAEIGAIRWLCDEMYRAELRTGPIV